jgi:tRNA dimethylallyltransferase
VVRSEHPRPVLAIVGATATGKSELATALAERLDGELINADALQIYRGLDIGTAKPSAEQRRRVPHHLLDVLDPRQPFSAGEFARRARPILEEIHGRRRLPIVVGGSGLYLRALFDGLAPIPPVPAASRRHWRSRLSVHGLEALYAELREVDPELAERVRPGDTQRILRALEVHSSTGRPLSAWQRESIEAAAPGNVRRIGLTLPRPILYDRIRRRVDEMIAAGWVAEVEALLEGVGSADVPAFRAIGYRELVRYLGGEWGLSEAVDATIRATRRYAKRQQTWFRREPGITWLERQELERQLPDLLDFLIRDGFRGGA